MVFGLSPPVRAFAIIYLSLPHKLIYSLSPTDIISEIIERKKNVYSNSEIMFSVVNFVQFIEFFQRGQADSST